MLEAVKLSPNLHSKGTTEASKGSEGTLASSSGRFARCFEESKEDRTSMMSTEAQGPLSLLTS